MTRALGTHDRQRRLGDPKRAEQVGFKLGPGLGLIDFFDRTKQPVARIVDHHVETAETRVRLRDCRIDLSLVCYIELDRGDLAAIALDERRERLGIPRRRRNAISSRQSCLSPDAAEALGRTSNEPDLDWHRNFLLRYGTS